MARRETERRGRRAATLAVLAAAFLAGAGPSAAQTLQSLPGVGGPVGQVTERVDDLTGRVGDLTGRVSEGAGELTERLSPRELLDARDLRLRGMVRADPKALDFDDHGWPVVRDQVLALSPSPEALTAAQGLGFRVLRETGLDELGLKVVVLEAPDGQSARQAVKGLRKLDPKGAYDFDHLYLASGRVGAAAPAAPARAPAADAGPAVRIGMVDTGVFKAEALAGSRVEQQGFAPGGLTPAAHGTAVASLLAGRGGAFRGAAPGASLYVADVYGGGPTGGSAEAVVRGLAWLAGKKTPVINVSLVGPPNNALEAAVKALQARGHVLVAAVGNDGPAAAPLYPASYPGVFAVTGVDARSRVLPEAGRGLHVDFAAPGSDMAAAAPDGYATVRGTSFAAPVVAGLIARRMSLPDPAQAARAADALAREAIDLGARGPDKIYGRGLVGADLRTAPAAVAAKGAVSTPR